MHHCQRLHCSVVCNKHSLCCAHCAGTARSASQQLLTVHCNHPSFHSPHCSLPPRQLASHSPALPAVLLLAAAVAVLTAAAGAAAGRGWALQDVHCAAASADCQHLAMLRMAPGQQGGLIRQLHHTQNMGFNIYI